MAERKKTPLWISIAQTMRETIANGQYEAGSRLPTEAELAGKFGVDRHTIRHAMAHLIEAGLVHSRRGAGYFVLSRPVDYPLGERVRFHQSLLAAGRLPKRKKLSIERRQASAVDAKRLRVSEGASLCVFNTLSFVDRNPVALSESCFPKNRLPGIDTALEKEMSVTAALKQVGVDDYVRMSTRLSARIATATQAVHLRLHEGAPLLFATSINVDQAGMPVEYGQTWYASDHITLTLERDEAAQGFA
jgi:GntR family phosphonate transport system transcriptional regulator